MISVKNQLFRSLSNGFRNFIGEKIKDAFRRLVRIQFRICRTLLAIVILVVNFPSNVRGYPRLFDYFVDVGCFSKLMFTYKLRHPSYTV